jgi:hypothetical protein
MKKEFIVEGLVLTINTGATETQIKFADEYALHMFLVELLKQTNRVNH